MITKDMVLMPILQLVYSYIEANEISIAVEKIELLETQLAEMKSPQQNIVLMPILQKVIFCLNILAEERDKAEALLIKYIDEPEPCCQCVVCRGCQRLFWIEFYGRQFGFRRYGALKQELSEQNHFVFCEIPSSLKQYLVADISATNYYIDRYRMLKKERDIEDKLFILKGMSSSTPALLNGALDTDAYNGGGLYFKMKVI